MTKSNNVKLLIAGLIASLAAIGLANSASAIECVSHASGTSYTDPGNGTTYYLSTGDQPIQNTSSAAAVIYSADSIIRTLGNTTNPVNYPSVGETYYGSACLYTAAPTLGIYNGDPEYAFNQEIFDAGTPGAAGSNFNIFSAWAGVPDIGGYSGSIVGFTVPTSAELQSAHDNLVQNVDPDLDSRPTINVSYQYNNGYGSSYNNTVPILNGDGTPFCDPTVIGSNQWAAAAPLLVNGIYCPRIGVASANITMNWNDSQAAASPDTTMNGVTTSSTSGGFNATGGSASTATGPDASLVH